MIGLVFVSHSASLAAGVMELVQQMTQGRVRMAAAGGIDDADNPIGTDPMRVVAAIKEVYSDDGVVVLMDLGSALMSAEMALEFLPPEQAERVRLCSAPLVEGAMAAAVQAAAGSDLEAVVAEAKGALQSKIEQLKEHDPMETADVSTPDAASTETAADGLALTVTVPNKLGLHARPAARLVQQLNQFAADVTVETDGRQVNAKSINRITTLGARRGDQLVFRAVGQDAQATLEAVQQLVDDNFGDPVTDESAGTDTAEPSTDTNENGGLAGAPGTAVGPIVRHMPAVPTVPEHPVDDAADAWHNLQKAIGDVVSTLRHMAKQVPDEEGGIFKAQQLIAQDPDLLDEAYDRIENEKMNAAAAWRAVMDELAARYGDLQDEYMRGRAADVRDVRDRVLRELLDTPEPALAFSEPSVLVARELSPSDTAQLDAAQVLGIVTEVGGATGHSAILARSLGIPAVVGAGPLLSRVSDGQMIGLDGRTGRLWLHPTEEEIEQLQAERAEWLARREAARAAAKEDAVTADGKRIEVGGNISSADDVAAAVANGAEGVGLFRTEFLYMDRREAPSEEAQYAAYCGAAEKLDGRSLIIRTVDVGGDKQIPYLDFDEEDNPFLGWRGIRFCLDRPDIFRPQLRAVLRAAADYPIKMMFPMVSSVSEVRRAKEMLDGVQNDLEKDGILSDADIEIGIMIELPSAVFVADQLAGEVDFFSIGTNDLTQYVMAADRGNVRVAGLLSTLQPAVLRAIHQTVQAGHEAGIWVGMCGEMAGDPSLTALLIGLGLDELSMGAPSIPAVKAHVRQTNQADAEALAAQALTLETAESVHQFLKQRE